MIKDTLLNAEVYYGLSEGIEKGLEWLLVTDFGSIPDGRYVIDGNKVYANVQSYETKLDALYEAHRDYIDIQYMISGVEKIGVVNYEKCEVVEEYDKENDIEFLKPKRAEEFLLLQKEGILILYPHDAHKPSIAIENPQQVRKAVVKVHI